MKLHDIFENDGGSIQPVTREDNQEIMQMMLDAFSAHASVDSIVGELKYSVDMKISKKLVVDGKIVGVYLLGERDLLQFLNAHAKYSKIELSPEDRKWLKGKRGVKGTALVVLPEYRARGFGKQLIDLPSKLGYDYIWGEALKSLNNLEHWLKRRKLVATVADEVYVTMQKL